MTMVNVPLLVLAAIAAICVVYLAVGGAIYVTGRLRGADRLRTLGRSIALGSVGVFLIYLFAVLLWTVSYGYDRRFGAAVGNLTMVSGLLVLVAPLGGGLWLYSRSDRTRSATAE